MAWVLHESGYSLLGIWPWSHLSPLFITCSEVPRPEASSPVLWLLTVSSPPRSSLPVGIGGGTIDAWIWRRPHLATPKAVKFDSPPWSPPWWVLPYVWPWLWSTPGDGSVQKPLSVKQPVESKFQQVNFPLSLENIFFKRTWIKQPWIITMSGLTNSNYKKHKHTTSNRVFKKSSCIWRHQSPCSTISPYLVKTNPWFACVICLNLKAPEKQKLWMYKIAIIPRFKTHQWTSFRHIVSSKKTIKISVKTSEGVVGSEQSTTI